MEQAIAILREYANEILAVYDGCVGILLLVTLHRIKRIEKQMRELIECITIKNDEAVQSISTSESLLEKQETANNMAEDTKTENTLKEAKERPEELIDAVLGEIF